MRVMLDIETLGLRPTAVILSVGAVAFELHSDTPSFYKEALWVPGIRQQLLTGRTIDAGTVEWWQDKEAATMAHWGTPANVCGVRPMLAGLATFIGKDTVPIWAHGCVFDIGALQNLYEVECDRKYPWRYDSIRDARTINRELPALRPVPPLKGMIPHHPVWDCKAQIWDLWSRMPLVGPRQSEAG